MFPVNWKGKVKLGCLLDTLTTWKIGDEDLGEELTVKIGQARQECKCESPTGIQFDCLVSGDGIAELRGILKDMCYASEGEPGYNHKSETVPGLNRGEKKQKENQDN